MEESPALPPKRGAESRPWEDGREDGLRELAKERRDGHHITNKAAWKASRIGRLQTQAPPQLCSVSGRVHESSVRKFVVV
jgi:hypothetical protein